MYTRAIIGTSTLFLGSSAFALAATPVIKSVEPAKDKNEGEPKKLMRPSELPLYSSQTSIVTKVKAEEEPSEIENMLLEPIGFVREKTFYLVDQVKESTGTMGKSAGEFTENFKFIVSYLREEDNEAQRIGAVAMGTVTGFIFGLKRGIFKKIIYSLAGTGAMGAICFPEETGVYVNIAKEQAKFAAKIGYNFVYGIKPGDPQPEFNFPEIKIPTTFQEVIDLSMSAGIALKETILPTKSAKDSKDN